MTRIIVVGGGAGGLELATKLGRTLGRKGRAKVTLVDMDAFKLELSIVCSPFCHSNGVDTYEVALLRNDSLIDIDSRNDVLGHQSKDDVLKLIKKLKKQYSDIVEMA